MKMYFISIYHRTVLLSIESIEGFTVYVNVVFPFRLLVYLFAVMPVSTMQTILAGRFSMTHELPTYIYIFYSGFGQAERRRDVNSFMRLFQVLLQHLSIISDYHYLSFQQLVFE